MSPVKITYPSGKEKEIGPGTTRIVLSIKPREELVVTEDGFNVYTIIPGFRREDTEDEYVFTPENGRILIKEGFQFEPLRDSKKEKSEQYIK